jgi:hypothetical protein
MAVQYLNGNLYDTWTPAAPMLMPSYGVGRAAASILNPSLLNQGYEETPGVGYAKLLGAYNNAVNTNNNTNGNGDQFSSAMSGGKSGTLQPYVNRMTQDANKALYGGLLNYQPSPIVAGDAGGVPVNSTPPQGFNLQSALLNSEFGKRSWMK